MLESQKLSIRAGEIRTKLSELAGVDELTDEQRSDLDKLRNEYGDIERRHSAAVIVEDKPVESRTATEGLETPEGKEQRELRSRCDMGNYISSAQEQRGLDGAENEYNQACGVRAGRFPLHLLVPEQLEKRQTTDTDLNVDQQTWVDRLFSESLASYCGITMKSVMPGVASVPVTTAGATSGQIERTEAKAVDAWAVGSTELKPKRNSTHLVFSMEDSYRMPGLEEALRRDMHMSITESVDKAVFLGSTSQGSASVADIVGLNTAANVVEKEIVQLDKVKGAATLAVFAQLIDGVHATMPEDLRIVASVGANTLWMSTLANTGNSVDTTIAEFMRRAGLSFRVRGGIETATLNGDWGAFIGRGRGIEGAGCAAIWDEGMFTRDEYTGAAKGEVGLTLHYFWDFKVPRATNFARLKFVT